MEQHQLESIAGWFAGRVPDGWFTGQPEVTFAEGQVRVLGALTAPPLSEGASETVRAGAEAGRISRFREETRRHRVWIAREVEHRFDVNVQWAARCGGTTVDFTPGGSRRGKGGSTEQGEQAEQGGSRPVEI